MLSLVFLNLIGLMISVFLWCIHDAIRAFYQRLGCPAFLRVLRVFVLVTVCLVGIAILIADIPTVFMYLPASINVHTMMELSNIIYGVLLSVPSILIPIVIWRNGGSSIESAKLFRTVGTKVMLALIVVSVVLVLPRKCTGPCDAISCGIKPAYEIINDLVTGFPAIVWRANYWGYTPYCIHGGI